MTALDKARALGAEHGRRDAEAWLSTTISASRAGILTRELAESRPEPDLSGGYDGQPFKRGLWEAASGVGWNHLSTRFEYVEAVATAYESAYREAVESVVRERCEGTS